MAVNFGELEEQVDALWDKAPLEFVPCREYRAGYPAQYHQELEGDEFSQFILHWALTNGGSQVHNGVEYPFPPALVEAGARLANKWDAVVNGDDDDFWGLNDLYVRYETDLVPFLWACHWEQLKILDQVASATPSSTDLLINCVTLRERARGRPAPPICPAALRAFQHLGAASPAAPLAAGLATAVHAVRRVVQEGALEGYEGWSPEFNESPRLVGCLQDFGFAYEALRDFGEGEALAGLEASVGILQAKIAREAQFQEDLECCDPDALLEVPRLLLRHGALPEAFLVTLTTPAAAPGLAAGGATEQEAMALQRTNPDAWNWFCRVLLHCVDQAEAVRAAL
mmetsp:Transcript_64802/g.148825  ORF Transcript_64802/g.148825 Transcript_64802/m.148825 type:complete len:341 (+) Transcript_64802:24-1046(+)